MISRKIIAASISGTLFTILLGFIMPHPFGEPEFNAEQNYLYSVSAIISFYLIFSFPVILIYGVITSIISDKIAMFFSKKNRNERVQMIISGVLHILFGLVLLPYSLGASILFWLTDQLLQQINITFRFLQAMISFLLPITIWMISLVIVWF